MSEMYQIIAVGVTGYTGRFVARHLAERQDVEQVSWAIAGRNTEKLLKLKRDLNLSDDVGVITSDTTNPKDADSLAKQAKVIITTVGPFSRYGEELVRACAESGTHLVDITGEVLWVHDMMQRYEGTAKKSGAKIVNCSGFDSIPADVGTYMAYNYLKERYGPETKFTDFRTVMYKGGVKPSGGTLASIFLLAEKIWEEGKETRDKAQDNYLLVSSGDVNTKTYSANRPAQNISPLVYDEDLKTWCCPSVFATQDIKVVFRTGSLLKGDGKEDPYSNLRFSEVVAVPHQGIQGAIEATIATIIYYLLCALVILPPTRHILSKLATKPGEGMSDDLADNSSTKLKFVATGRTKEGGVVKAFGRIGCDSEELGYRGTGRMVSEMAFSLLDLSRQGKEGNGGFITPAAAGREILLERLRNRGIVFCIGDEETEWPKKNRVAVGDKKTD